MQELNNLASWWGKSVLSLSLRTKETNSIEWIEWQVKGIGPNTGHSKSASRKIWTLLLRLVSGNLPFLCPSVLIGWVYPYREDKHPKAMSRKTGFLHLLKQLKWPMHSASIHTHPASHLKSSIFPPILNKIQASYLAHKTHSAEVWSHSQSSPAPPALPSSPSSCPLFYETPKLILSSRHFACYCHYI